MENDFKEKYYKLLKSLTEIESQILYKRCPAVKVCCGACLLIRDKIKEQKKQNGN